MLDDAQGLNEVQMFCHLYCLLEMHRQKLPRSAE